MNKELNEAIERYLEMYPEEENPIFFEVQNGPGSLLPVLKEANGRRVIFEEEYPDALDSPYTYTFE